MAKVSDFTPDSGNANKGTQRGLKALDTSLRQYGAGRSILVDRKGRIIAGNKTAERAADIGLDDVIVVETDGTKLVAVKRTDLDLEDDGGKARALATYDNRSGQLDLDWDIDALSTVDADVLKNLWTVDELDELGIIEKPQGDAEPQIDRAAELQEKWQVKTGDLWKIGEHRLLCGDSTKRDDVEKVMGGEKAEMMVTDPPYGVEYSPEWRTAAGLSNSERMGKVTNDDRASWAMAFTHFKGNVAYVWYGSTYSIIFDRALVSCGFNIRAQIIWVKPRIVLSRGQYHWRHEACIYAVRKGESAHWAGSRKQTTIWANIIDYWDPKEPLYATLIAEDTLLAFDAGMTTVWEIGLNDGEMVTSHSTQKPLECMARPIRNHEFQLIYEPFCGSGTTIVACQNLVRKCRAIEISPEYCAVTLERMATAFPGIEIERIDGAQ